MKKYPLTFLQIGLLTGSRATAAMGLALALSGKVSPEKRAPIGWTLLGFGSIFYLTLLADVLLSGREPRD